MTSAEKVAEVEEKMRSIVRQCPLADMVLEAAVMSFRLKIPGATAREVAVRVYQEHKAETREASRP